MHKASNNSTVGRATQNQYTEQSNTLGRVTQKECYAKSHSKTVKGEEAKTRPPETLTNADFKILYS